MVLFHTIIRTRLLDQIMVSPFFFNFTFAFSKFPHKARIVQERQKEKRLKLLSNINKERRKNPDLKSKARENYFSNCVSVRRKSRKFFYKKSKL
jgi:hypothetical protein